MGGAEYGRSGVIAALAVLSLLGCQGEAEQAEPDLAAVTPSPTPEATPSPTPSPQPPAVYPV
jgi:hypothetical protein